MCHEISAFIPALPLHLHPHPCLAGHAAATTCSPASGAGCREDGSSAERSSDIFSLSPVQRAPVMAAVMEHPCMVCPAVSTRDGSRTPTRGLHRGHYNTDRLQGFPQEVICNWKVTCLHLKQCYSYANGHPRGNSAQAALRGKETGLCWEGVTQWHLRDQPLTGAQDTYSKCHHTGRSIKHKALVPRILLFQHTSWTSQDQTHWWQLQLISKYRPMKKHVHYQFY